MTGQEAAIHDMTNLINQAIECADSLGLIVTVEQKPLQPLAMGNVETVVTVRPKYNPNGS